MLAMAAENHPRDRSYNRYGKQGWALQEFLHALK